MYPINVIIYILCSFHLCKSSNQLNFINDIHEHVQIPCENDAHCTGIGFKGVKCVENLCECVDKNNCKSLDVPVHVTKIGKFCNLHTQCYVKHSQCNQGKCECSNNTVASKDRRQCLKRRTELGSHCEESSQCIRLRAVCIDGICSCPLKMHYTNSRCHRSVAIGSVCETNEECTHTLHSKCLNKKCKCNSNHVYSPKYSECLAKAHTVSSPCIDSSQCSSTLGLGSECYEGFCRCKEVYNYKSSINTCVLDLLLGNECGNHTDCHQIGNDESRLECILGICECKIPYVEHYGYCVKNSGWTWSSFALPDVLPFIFTYAFFYVIR